MSCPGPWQWGQDAGRDLDQQVQWRPKRTANWTSAGASGFGLGSRGLGERETECERSDGVVRKADSVKRGRGWTWLGVV